MLVRGMGGKYVKELSEIKPQLLQDQSENLLKYVKELSEIKPQPESYLSCRVREYVKELSEIKPQQIPRKQ